MTMEQKPEPTYTRKQVQQALEAAAEIAEGLAPIHGAAKGIAIGIRAIDIDLVVKGE